jgi:hypothetical protein
MTGDLEDRVRAMLTDRAELIESATTPPRALPSGPRSRLDRRAAVLAAVAAAVVVVAGLGVLAHSHWAASIAIGPDRSGATTPAPTTPAPTTPAPTQADAVRQYFDTDPAWASQFGPHVGPLYCGVDVMGVSKDGHFLYLYVDCEGFAIQDGVVAVATGTQEPVRATVTGSGAQTRIVALKRPLDGNPFEATLRALFPTALADRVMKGQFSTEPTLPVLQAQFARSAAAAAAAAAARASTSSS